MGALIADGSPVLHVAKNGDVTLTMFSSIALIVLWITLVVIIVLNGSGKR